MASSLSEYVINEIKKTGYPLEIKVSEILNKQYITQYNELFIDEDENKSREIDVTAFSLRKNIEQEHIKPYHVQHDVVIECKKSETKAWVFFY
jgi:hypothetical protein